TGLAPAHDEYDRMAEFYGKLGQVKTFAVLARDNLHEVAAAKGFADSMKGRGFSVVYSEVVPGDTKDFSSVLLKMKAASPDLIAIESLPPPFTIQVLKQAQEQGIGAKDIVLGHGVVPVLKAMGPAAENLMSLLYSFEGDTPDHKEFNALCQAAGFEPWQYSEAGIRYRTFRRVEDALKRAGTLDKEAVRDAMWSADFPLFGSERMKIDSKGYGTDVPYPVQFKGGKYVSLWPLEKGLQVHQFKNAW
ncbi:MAG TPA: ABC transporter substrate-binding protein, partial [bacterium]|nr:ABC transporter substrate-binding protein [bacterium]